MRMLTILRAPAWRRWGFILLLACGLSLLGLAPAAAAQGDGATQLTILAPALNVRGGPGVAYPSLAVLNGGDEIAALGQDPVTGWWQVQLLDGRTGWISGGPTYVAVSGSPAAVAAEAAPAPGPAAASGGTIVFQTASGGAIYAVNADGSNLRYLTTGLDPALSPDGQWVAFTRWQNSQLAALGDLWVINVDGSGERAVLGDIYQPSSPTWSPDGKSLIIGMQHGGRIKPEDKCSGGRPPADAENIHREEEGKDDIVFCYTLPPRPYYGLRRVDVATGAFEDLPNDDQSFGPTWDPADPNRLVYAGAKGLISLDLATGQSQLLTEDTQQRTPVFSPDGSRLAVTYRQDDHWDVHVLNADGGDDARLTETSYRALAEQELRGEQPHAWSNASPAWSPDGRQIAFVTDRTGQWEIWVMNADGSNQRPLFPAGTLAGISLRYDGMNERMLSWR